MRRLASLAVVILLALLAPWWVTSDPNQIDLAQRLMPPSSAAWFGTDLLGRDLFSRTLHGTAVSFGLSVLVTFTATLAGVILGAMAGWFYKTWFDHLFNVASSMLSAVPFLLIMAAALSLLSPSLVNAYIVLAAVLWVGPARICRAEVIRTKSLEYVLAATALGASRWRVLTVHVMPACLRAPITHALVFLPEVIALEAALSFLGLGAQPPQASLGRMVFDGLSHLGAHWWMSMFPALALAIIVALIRVLTLILVKHDYSHRRRSNT